MPFQFATKVEYDLLPVFGLINGPSATKSIVIDDQFFATCATSQNWKPFVIGIIAPDNPIDFVPVRKLARELQKADMPPKLPSSGTQGKTWNSKNKKDKSGAPPSGIVPMRGTAVTVDQQREALRSAYTKKNGGNPPSDALLALMCAQMWTESGGVYRDHKTGQQQVKPVFHPPNYNSFGYHDVGAKPATYKAQKDGEGNWIDDQGNVWGPNGEQIKNNGTIGMVRAGQLYFAPQSGESTFELVSPSAKGGSSAFYSSIQRPGQRFLGTDTEGGNVYISSYKSFNTFDEAAAEFVGYIYDTFPQVRSATTPEEYENAIMNGVVQNGITRRFHDPSAKIREAYVTGLRNGLEAYGNRYGSTEDNSLSGNGGAGRSTDATDDPAQRLMAYGSTFELDDPLASVWGRNIAADETRLAQLQARMDGLNAQLTFMRNIPPLVLLVNPQEFKRSHENMVDAGTKTRVGNIVHTWFEQPVKISASGVSAAQFAVGADMAGGLTNYNRVHSLSYRNLMSLVMLYKSNGSLYDYPSSSGQESVSAAGDGSIVLPGSIFIYYDDHVYIGSFDDMSLTDAADKPHNMAYSFSFTVRYDIHVDLGVDAQLSSVLR